jgi:23S rRNA (uridine2479-2'-O)-methyltransferase
VNKKKPIIKISNENNEYQRFEVLKRNRQKRFNYQEFFVEGVRNINEAIRNNWHICFLIYSRKKKLSDWAENIIQNQQVDQLIELTFELMKKLSRKEETSELIAIIKSPPDDENRIKLSNNFLITIIDRSTNKGNLGTIIRTCDALSCQGLILAGRSVDLYDPEVIVASTGSFFNLPIIRIPSLEDLLSWVAKLKQSYENMQIIGTSAKAKYHIDECDLTLPTLLLLGNETRGLRKKFKEISTQVCKIPMTGSASSLNISCAHSILLYEINRQRNQINKK